MSLLMRFLAKCVNLLRRSQADREMERDIAAHLGLLEEDFLRRGLSPAEARIAARRKFGAVELAKDLHRDERSFVWLEQLMRDFLLAARGLAREPGFALIAIITLALGIGVNTTLFSAYNALALKPLPVADPNRVVRLERWFESRSVGSIQYLFSYPEYSYLREHDAAFSDLVAESSSIRVVANAGGGVQAWRGQLVSANYFSALGVSTVLGRTFLADEDRAPGGSPVVVLSSRAWKRWFHNDSEALGAVVQMNGTPFTVVGAAPEEFIGAPLDGPMIPDFWAPVSMQAELTQNASWSVDPSAYQFQLLGRLKPSVSLRSAQSQTDVLLRQFASTHKPQDRTLAVTLQHTALLANTEDIRFQSFVAALMLVAGLVLLVACVNLANMLLARGAARQREISVHLALGASRSRVIRKLLAESMLIAGAGGIASWFLSHWSCHILTVAITQTVSSMLGDQLALHLDLSPDYRVLLYALCMSMLTGVLFGLWPAQQCTRLNLAPSLKDGGAAAGRSLSQSRMRSVLIAAQVACSMLLLLTAGLLLRGVVRSQAANPGFETKSVLLMLGDFGTVPALAGERQRRILDRLQAVPEVGRTAVGAYPMMGTWTPPIVVAPSNPEASPVRERTLASYASSGFFETLGIPLIRGRKFTQRESEAGAPVAVISESTARRFWPGADALGQRFKLDLDFRGVLTEFEVVGIASDVRFANLSRTDPAHVYVPPRPDKFQGALLRLGGDRRRALEAIRHEIAAADPSLLPGLSLLSIEDGPLAMQKRLAEAYAMFASVLAGLALALAGVGIYGVMAFLVSQRQREIGVRMAIGATAGELLRSVILRGLRSVFVGMAIGTACAAALSYLLHTSLSFPGASDLLYGIPFYDPLTFLALPIFVTIIAAFASAVPAIRALRVDPMIALRCE